MKEWLLNEAIQKFKTSNIHHDEIINKLSEYFFYYDNEIDLYIKEAKYIIMALQNLNKKGSFIINEKIEIKQYCICDLWDEQFVSQGGRLSIFLQNMISKYLLDKINFDEDVCEIRKSILDIIKSGVSFRNFIADEQKAEIAHRIISNYVIYVDCRIGKCQNSLSVYELIVPRPSKFYIELVNTGIVQCQVTAVAQRLIENVRYSLLYEDIDNVYDYAFMYLDTLSMQYSISYKEMTRRAFQKLQEASFVQ